ncbi:TenA family protein [Salinibaculum rarum]|uniref:TenA family protein n=1 Tax=Salinibaculum rarum TaxID=3058903 RepID=UPI00265EEBB0|nr:TenA family protein [Salinibaculum sp. KK48]
MSDDDADTEAGDVPESYALYAYERTDARFTDWVRARAEPLWTEATTHRFTEELRADTLDDDVFGRYLIQDYAFLETLVGAFGHAVADAPTMSAKSRLSDFLGVLTADENDYFERSFDALGVDEATCTDPGLTPTTRAFEDLLVRAAGEGGYAETLAVLVPAEWIYLSWATPEPDQRPGRFYLAEWIDLHANDEFAQFVGWLRAELDREGAAASTRRQARLERLFRRTVELEVAFFDAAYDPDTGAPDGHDSDSPVSGGGETW